MYKILVFGMTENPGGVESFLRNYISQMDHSKLQFDYLCNSYEPVAYEDELIAEGGKTIHFTARSRDYRQYKKEMKEFFSGHASEYQAIWVNVSSLANIDYLKYARKYGIPMRIIHSHNSRNMDSRLRGALHHFNRNVIGRYATDYWACSEEAAKWFYKSSLQSRVQLIRNAISTERMEFKEEKRAALRKELGYENKFVIGNVGRLHFQKNQKFLLKVFAEVLKKNRDARLILVGQGEDEEKLKIQARELHIEKAICWAGVQSDISQWLSAFDVFAFPSIFEGAPIAALEAQANGVPVVSSIQGVGEACVLNRNCKRLSLEESKERWADTILAAGKASRLTVDEIRRNFKRKGYDICTEVKRVEKLLYR